MKFLDLDREYEYTNWQKVLQPVFDSKSFINGEAVKTFEKKIASYIGSKYAIGVSSGTDAIMVAIMALGVKNPVVLTTPYTFISTVEAPIRLGCKVIFADVNKDFNIDMDCVKEILQKKHVDIFLPVHLFGKPCKLDNELIDICNKKNIKIIEDCAQSMGSRWLDKINQKVPYTGPSVIPHSGSIGDAGCFSFFPSKNLACAGDGGLITTNDKTIYESCVAIRGHGCRTKYVHEMHGGNFRLDTIQAALLEWKLHHFHKFLMSRKKTAVIYNKELESVGDLVLPIPDANESRTYNQYVIQTKRRDELLNYLSSKDIPTAIYYPISLDEQPCYKGYDFECDCYTSRDLAKTNLALPVGFVSDEEARLVVKTIRGFYATR